MRMFFLFFSALFILPFMESLAQQRTDEADDRISINGLKYGYTYTPEQVKAALGNPHDINSWDDDFGKGYAYYYGEEDENGMGSDLVVRFNDDVRQNMGLHDIIICSKRFSLIVDGIELRIGDHMDKMKTLPGFSGFDKFLKKRDDCYAVIFNNIHDDSRLRFWFDKDGFMTQIAFLYIW